MTCVVFLNSPIYGVVLECPKNRCSDLNLLEVASGSVGAAMAAHLCAYTSAVRSSNAQSEHRTTMFGGSVPYCPPWFPYTALESMITFPQLSSMELQGG